MDWSTQLNSILTETDSNMAEIKHCLNTASITSKADLLLDRLKTEAAFLLEPPIGPPSLHIPSATKPSSKIDTDDLTAISKQLHSQAQVIESLTKTVQRLKHEKELQQQSITNLEKELDRLHPNPRSTLDSILGCSVERLMSECRSRQQTSKPSDRDSTRDLSSNPCIGKEMSACGLRKKSNLDSILECKVERLSECHSRQQTSKPSDRDCTPDLNASPAFVKDMLESKKALCQEYKSIRREIEQLKVKLELQEEHLFSQISASHDIKKTQRQYCRMLEDLICSHKAQTQDLNKARSETHSTQRELCRIKSTVTVLIEQVANLHLEDKLYAMAKKEKSLRCKKKKKKMNECVLAALLCECSSSECNLTDVCSDELCSDGELAGNKIFIPAMEQTATENNETMLDSEMCTTLPELNLSDLISLT